MSTPNRLPPSNHQSFDPDFYTSIADDISTNFLQSFPTEHKPPIPIHQFNNAGSSPSPLSVLQSQIRHQTLETLLDGYAAAALAQTQLQETYRNIATLINASSPTEIALMESATVGWTRAFYAMVDRTQIANGDVMLCCEVEYAANVVAMSKVANERGAELIVIPSIPNTGVVDLKLLQRMLHGEWVFEKENTVLDPHRIKLVCITHIPTNCGVINPVNQIGEILEEYNTHHRSASATQIGYIVDACQSVGQIRVDVRAMKCHALTATGRKYLRGPRGTGFLYVSRNVELAPSHIDHFGAPVSDVPASFRHLRFDYLEGAKRFEFWESSIANRIGLGRAVRYALDRGMEEIERSCTSMGEELKMRLRELNGVYIHHDNVDSKELQCGIVSFRIPNVESQTFKARLLENGFLLSVVPATSTPYDSSKCDLKVDLVRASLSYFNNVEEIDAFCDVLSEIVRESD